MKYAQHGVGGIPGKAIVNNCVHFISEVKRISSKTELSQQESEIKETAWVVASLSSNHSWKTYKYLHHDGEFDNEAFVGETGYALKEGWKNISESDYAEVKNKLPKDHLLNRWKQYALDEKHRNRFSQLYNKFQKEQAYELQPETQR